jgi:hypothetical protein
VVLNIQKEFWKELIAYFPSARHGPHRQRRVQKLFYFFICILCRGKVFTEPLYSNHTGVYTQIECEIGSGAVTHIPSFIRNGSGIQKLKGGDSQTNREHGDLISLVLFIYFFKIMELGQQGYLISLKMWGGKAHRQTTRLSYKPRTIF